MPITSSLSSKIRNMSIVCAFLVVVIHCRPDFALGSAGWWVRQFLENGITAIAVPFFFTVSGFFISAHIGRGEYRAEVKKRMTTLVLPYFLWIAVFWAYSLGLVNLLRYMRHDNGYFYFPDFEQWGIWLTGNPLLGQLWYVRALFLIVLASPVLYRFVFRFRRKALMALFALYVIVCPWTDVVWNGWLLDFARCGAFPVLGIFYFSLGMAIGMGVVRTGHARLHPVVSLAVGMGLVFACAWFHLHGYPGGGYFGCLSIPFTLYAVWKFVPESKWPDWLVRYSFSVYVVHVFFVVVFRDLVNSGSSVAAYVGMAVLIFSLSVVVSGLFHRFAPRFSKFAFGGR